MWPEWQAPASRAAQVIVNPLSGERITIREPAAGHAVLAWELELAPGGRVPSSHAHPEQEERFTVLDGQMRFRVGRRRIVAGPGDTVRVPPGTVHHFANASGQPARVAVKTMPALSMQDLLETAAALAQRQHAAAGRIRRRMPSRLQALMPRQVPSPVDLALFMRDFEREVRAPYLPRPLVRTVTGALAWLATRVGLDRRYTRAKGLSAPKGRGAACSRQRGAVPRCTEERGSLRPSDEGNAAPQKRPGGAQQTERK